MLGEFNNYNIEEGIDYIIKYVNLWVNIAKKIEELSNYSINIITQEKNKHILENEEKLSEENLQKIIKYIDHKFSKESINKILIRYRIEFMDVSSRNYEHLKNKYYYHINSKVVNEKLKVLLNSNIHHFLKNAVYDITSNIDKLLDILVLYQDNFQHIKKILKQNKSLQVSTNTDNIFYYCNKLIELTLPYKTNHKK